METISRDQARSLVKDREQENVTVVEALPEEYFNKYHLPGARNVPLDENFDETIQQVAPDKSQPVMVYCADADCDASPKAAKRMEELGYTRVFDYEAGKVDWKEAGLTVED